MPDPSAPLFDIHVTELPDGTLVRVSGEIDLSTAGKLAHAPETSDGNLRVVVDLANVRFIGSAGLGVLIEARQRQTDRVGTLTLRHPTRQARWVLGVARLDGLSDIEDDPRADGGTGET